MSAAVFLNEEEFQRMKATTKEWLIATDRKNIQLHFVIRKKTNGVCVKLKKCLSSDEATIQLLFTYGSVSIFKSYLDTNTHQQTTQRRKRAKSDRFRVRHRYRLYAVA